MIREQRGLGFFPQGGTYKANRLVEVGPLPSGGSFQKCVPLNRDLKIFPCSKRLALIALGTMYPSLNDRMNTSSFKVLRSPADGDLEFPNRISQMR